MDTKAIRESLEKATPGPWKVYQNQLGRHWETLIGTEHIHPQLNAPDSVVAHAYGVDGQYVYIRSEDATLIANAPEWLRQLLNENERLQAEVETLKPRPVICYPNCKGASPTDDYIGMHMSNEECPACAAEKRKEIERQADKIKQSKGEKNDYS